MPPSTDLVGRVFDRLTVLEQTGRDKFGNVLWLCKCIEGNLRDITTSRLLSGHTTSCGCKQKESNIKRLTKHNASRSVLYEHWENMKQRCLNPKAPHYPLYGGRGIEICNRWLDFQGFKDDLEASFKEGAGLTLDRIDNDGNYCPENCRWATQKEQMRNRNNTCKCWYKGELLPLGDILDRYGDPSMISYSTLATRIFRHKWDIDIALTTPVRFKNPNGLGRKKKESGL